MIQILITYSYLKRFLVARKNYKYFIGYLNKYKTKPFSVTLPKTRTYIKSYNGEIKWMYFY